MKVKNKYGFLPTSVLHFGKTRKLTRGYLQDQQLRKSKVGDASSSSMSEFNPDLCKFIIQYWSEEGELIVDPFHGWGTRAAISNQLKRNYIGFDVSKVVNDDVKNMMATQAKAKRWFNGAGVDLLMDLRLADGIKIPGIEKDSVDLVFSCPPYFNIEKYESADGQLSDLNNYEEFMKLMHQGALRYFDVLKQDKYCVMVVGDWRENKELRLLSKDMIDAYTAAGFKMHDFIIHKLNSAAVVGCGNFDDNNFVTKSHEYILVFRKPRDDEKPSHVKQIIHSKLPVVNRYDELLDEIRKEYPGIDEIGLKSIYKQRYGI